MTDEGEVEKGQAATSDDVDVNEINRDNHSEPEKVESLTEKPKDSTMSAVETPSTAPTVVKPKRQSGLSGERARAEVGGWIGSRKLSKVDSDALDVVLKEADGLKEKVAKLKSLLGRSAKAQRESKAEATASQQRLDKALKEIDRLNRKVDKLANRPTHMELLADFETKFDRAMLQVGQPGGEDTGPPTGTRDTLDTEDQGPVVDAMLMQELGESKQRVDKLESLNATLVDRTSALEAELREMKQKSQEMGQTVAHLELEKRMAVMEAEHATKAMQEKAASLAEMQMEIELVTKASVTANKRAAKGEEMAKTVISDKHHVDQLESQVVALKEWALASAEAKTLSQERVRLLETQLQALRYDGTQPSEDRTIWSKNGTLIVGAGDVGLYVAELETDIVKKVKMSERVVLRWKFDLSGESLDILFSILKGKCETKSDQKKGDELVSKRTVQGGAAGEIEDAFNIGHSCTLLWNNAKSWIRPKTIRYNLSAIVLTD